jgi:hypothetical protein
MTLPAGCADLTSKLAARVTGALRQFDGFATAIDVAVAQAPTKPESSEPLEDEGPRP